MPRPEGGRFVSEKIEMVQTGEGSEPVLFRWRSAEHQVTEIISCWQDWDYPVGVTKKNWKNRRHRNYFEVRTDSYHHLLMYFDRGVKPTSPKTWVVYEEYL
ncbi:MAG: hypothetical protein NTW14_01275 [bacterium]|nr:hypothetical protein [bacterium]